MHRQHHLHGVYCKQVFDAAVEDDTLIFRRVSPDGEEGYLGTLRKKAAAESGESVLRMEAFTTQPAMQLYTGNFVHMDAAPFGKGGVRYPRYAGFCLESQHYPCSPNFPAFPTTVLRPGEEYREKTVYRFISK